MPIAQTSTPYDRSEEGNAIDGMEQQTARSRPWAEQHTVAAGAGGAGLARLAYRGSVRGRNWPRHHDGCCRFAVAAGAGQLSGGRVLSAKILSLRDSTMAIVEGDMSRPITTKGPCEVGELADSFREMVARLNHNMVRMNILAYTDTITGLPNRTVITHVLALAQRTQKADCAGAIIFIDLDGFKRINDTLGHDAGDELLRQVAARIMCAVCNWGWRIWKPAPIPLANCATRARRARSLRVLPRMNSC
jgi:HAMP domain-containing protein